MRLRVIEEDTQCRPLAYTCTWIHEQDSLPWSQENNCFYNSYNKTCTNIFSVEVNYIYNKNYEPLTKVIEENTKAEWYTACMGWKN